MGAIAGRGLVGLCVLLLLGMALLPAAPVRADGDELRLEVLEKGQVPDDGQSSRAYTIAAPANRQILIGAVNLDSVDSTETNLRLQVTCPLPSSLIPAGSDGVATAENGRAIYCTTPSEGSTSISVTIEAISGSVNYGLFAQSLKDTARESPLDLPGDVRVIDSLNAQRIHLYRVKYIAGYDNGWSAVQYRGDNPRAMGRVYSSIDGRVKCRSVRWKQSGSDGPPEKSATCNLFDGTNPSSYLVVMNYGDKCVRYQLHVMRSSQSIEGNRIGTCD